MDFNDGGRTKNIQKKDNAFLIHIVTQEAYYNE
jgi:hypothetical protein